MGYNIAVYVDDYLMLLEFQEMFDKSFPKERVSIFSTDKLSDGMGDDIHDIFENDLSKLKSYDLIILLHELNEKHLKGFSGTIIDITSSVTDGKYEVRKVEEPILSVINNLDIDKDKLSVTVGLPAIIYGKDGIEDFMRQSRDIFTFESKENLILKERLAFNAHFNIDKLLVDNPISKSINIVKESGADILVDMLPLSTVFILDVNSDEPFELISSSNYLQPEETFMASDVAESSSIFIIKRRNGFRFIGDYNKVLISNIAERIKEVIS